MGAKQGWVKMPVEPAARWLKLSAVARGIGADLFRVYQDTVVGLDMDEVEDAFTRLLGPNPGERKTIRMAIRSIIDAGLIAQVEGGVRLLYSRETYVSHGAETERTVPQPYVNGTATIPTPYVNHTSMVAQPYVEGTVSVGSKSAESLDTVFTQEREKERKRERDASLALLPHEPLEEPRPKKPAKTGAASALRALEAALKTEMAKKREAAPALSISLGKKAASRVADHAEATGGTHEKSAAMLASAWAIWGNGNAWKLCDLPFGEPRPQVDEYPESLRVRTVGADR